MNETIANQIYDVLATACGASEDMRVYFIDSLFDSAFSHRSEFRFQGALGFGGKFKRDHRRFYVTYYPEDKTAERDAMVERANVALEAVWEKAQP